MQFFRFRVYFLLTYRFKGLFFFHFIGFGVFWSFSGLGVILVIFRFHEYFGHFLGFWGISINF